MDSNHKICTGCNETLLKTNFYKDKYNKQGLSSKCKKCKNNQKNIYLKKISEIEKEIPNEKECKICKLIKIRDNFTKLKSNKDGLASYCKDCRRFKDKEIKNNVLKNPIEIIENYNKICIKCNIEKNIINYKINRKSSDNFFNICNICLPTNKWNKEKQRLSEKKYREKNYEKIKEKDNKPNNKIRHNLNKRIAMLMIQNNSRKKNKTIDYIGCDINFFKKWMEFQFQEGMTWENYGKWHLDHVKPCASFNLLNDDDIKECFNWKNIQPLWANLNLKKSNKIDIEMIEKHTNKANIYEKTNLLSL